MKKGRIDWRLTLLDKFQMLAILLFIFGLFVFDVNANNIAAYSLETQVNIFNGIKVPASSMFWLGFLVALGSFFTISIRSMFYHKKYPTKLDMVFGTIGIIGLMVVLSGGMLLFWHDNSLIIPFFGLLPTRIDYYHFGISLSILSLLYFALTK